MPLVRSPSRDKSKEAGAAPQAQAPAATASTTRPTPSASTTGASAMTGTDTGPPTPSKGILKLSKADLVKLVRDLRAHLGKSTDAATTARYEAYSKENLIDEYYTLRAAANAPPRNPNPLPAPQQQDMAAMFLAARQDNERAINEANRRMDALLEVMTKTQREAEERLEQQRRDAAEDRRVSDERMERLLQALGATLQVRAGEEERAADRPVRDAPAAPAAQPRGPRTFDYAVVPHLSQDATYREFREWREAWTNNARVKQFGAFERETQV